MALRCPRCGGAIIQGEIPGERYRSAAADYLGLPRAHPSAQWAARQAQAIADLAAFAYLRQLAQSTTEGGEADAGGAVCPGLDPGQGSES